MKKTLIALAAVAATAAYAQSTVEIYGRMDLGYSASKTTKPAETTKTTSLAGAANGRTTSRLGFKGTEDLGSGLKAFFNYEVGINPDYTSHPDVDTSGDTFKQDGAITTRLANLGVTGGFGTVIIGTYLNVFDDMTGASVFNLSGSATNGATAATRLGIIQTHGRSTNAIGYSSPSFGGLTIGFGTSQESTKKNGVKDGQAGTVLSARYAGGPLSVSAGYSAVDFDGKNAVDSKLFGSTPKEGKGTEFAVKGTYNLGVAVPYAIYANSNRKADGVKIAKTKGYEIGSTFPMGDFSPFVSYGSNKLTTIATNKVDKSTGSSLGVTYAMSKRTSLYAQTTSAKTKADGV